MSTFKICIIQALITDDLQQNYMNITKLVSSSCNLYNPDLLVLPDSWINLNKENQILLAQEESSSEYLLFLKNLSKEHNKYIIGGSIPEKENDKYYNTCYCFNSQGEVKAKHRQVHFLNNKLYSSGDKFTVFETPFAKIGVGIDEDLRFMEYSQVLKSLQCNLLVFPLSYQNFKENDNCKIISQGRALDNNIYLVCASCYKNDSDSGYSHVVNPYGEIIINSSSQECSIMSVIDLGIIDKIQESIPTLKQKRLDLYELVNKINN